MENNALSGFILNTIAWHFLPISYNNSIIILQKWGCGADRARFFSVIRAKDNPFKRILKEHAYDNQFSDKSPSIILSCSKSMLKAVILLPTNYITSTKAEDKTEDVEKNLEYA